MHKDHALHNEQLCDHLLTDGKYNDWVVTTAFYSALHFVRHKIFPFNTGGKNYLTFDDYYNRTEKRGIDKHSSLKMLVCKNIKSCSGAYRWLLDASMLSRYNNYIVTTEKAKKARAMLDVVKGHSAKN